MTQNKTALQEALSKVVLNVRGEIHSNDYPDMDMDVWDIIYKAAKSYADLPEKIEAMKPKPSIFGETPSEIRNDERIDTLDDILNLLKEGV